ncbi:MAG: uncharacterized protein KVP18_005175 [Porospora cf. gigantea A]|uniref:uncharacterized protein n=1 Tax=Porospora cf. gigantea A TaxID=2853593 RepID=UPI003559F508|nr:MAG: hypothetical protein KVP18_005175 [Porospora cf. gigantea A]
MRDLRCALSTAFRAVDGNPPLSLSPATMHLLLTEHTLMSVVRYISSQEAFPIRAGSLQELETWAKQEGYGDGLQTVSDRSCFLVNLLASLLMHRLKTKKAAISDLPLTELALDQRYNLQDIAEALQLPTETGADELCRAVEARRTSGRDGRQLLLTAKDVTLAGRHWKTVTFEAKRLNDYYAKLQQGLFERFDVTLEAFLYSSRVGETGKVDNILQSAASAWRVRPYPAVGPHSIFSADTSLLTRRRTKPVQSPLKKIRIPPVPDRGGRTLDLDKRDVQAFTLKGVVVEIDGETEDVEREVEKEVEREVVAEEAAEEAAEEKGGEVAEEKGMEVAEEEKGGEAAEEKIAEVKPPQVAEGPTRPTPGDVLLETPDP